MEVKIYTKLLPQTNQIRIELEIDNVMCNQTAYINTEKNKPNLVANELISREFETDDMGFSIKDWDLDYYKSLTLAEKHKVKSKKEIQGLLAEFTKNVKTTNPELFI